MAKESIAVNSRRKVKKIRGENEPKKPTTEYFMFLRDERKNLQAGLSVKEQTKILSKLWAELDPSTKKKYSEEYASSFEKYKAELEEYKKTAEYQEVLKQNQEQKLSGEKKGKKAQVTRKPSGYNLFVKEERARMAEERGSAAALSFKEISQMISKKWQSLEAGEKEAYKAKAASEEGEKALENVEPQ
ncbi:uncharacterized protein NEMAJ01_0776 [Nematocida major]|uniref:uncharacterized protein n=1 Tax=Nematocida major TaxID=1912982 RepID=UPI002007C1FC|nr:uncharacterized protein NEMAJ01_0776 [Nematocida major]KAH9385880.1 hypothetical protein NEMAJ01_0776 [Nematocida major]